MNMKFRRKGIYAFVAYKTSIKINISVTLNLNAYLGQVLFNLYALYFG